MRLAWVRVVDIGDTWRDLGHTGLGRGTCLAWCVCVRSGSRDRSRYEKVVGGRGRGSGVGVRCQCVA